jgi:hypothetical protein
MLVSKKNRDFQMVIKVKIVVLLLGSQLRNSKKLSAQVQKTVIRFFTRSADKHIEHSVFIRTVYI